MEFIWLDARLQRDVATGIAKFVYDIGSRIVFRDVFSCDLDSNARNEAVGRNDREFDMLLDELHLQRETITRLARRYGARRLRVFGSVARREERTDSDVDFLVDFPRGYDLFAQRLPLAEELSGLLRRRVELILEHELNRHIRDQVMQEAVDL